VGKGKAEQLWWERKGVRTEMMYSYGVLCVCVCVDRQDLEESDKVDVLQEPMLEALKV